MCFVSFVALQSSRWEKESSMLSFNCLLRVIWWIVLCDFLVMLSVGHQCLILAFPDPTHFISGKFSKKVINF